MKWILRFFSRSFLIRMSIFFQPLMRIYFGGNKFIDPIDGSGYQIDSSIIFKDPFTGSTFFNTVDNPLSPEDFSYIRRRTSLSSITLATKACGSASQYPQSFLDLDRVNERSSVLNHIPSII